MKHRQLGSFVFYIANVLMIGAVATPNVVIAADAAPGAKPLRVIEEITVSARKREERAIDTPVAIAALSQVEVERYNSRDLADLTARLPGLSITHAAGGGAGGNIAIRGVGNLAVDYGADQPVALVLDGMSFTRGHVLDVGFFDVSGVQVLKGPQALFYGKNSPAGVVSVSSRTPKVGGAMEYFTRVGYEFRTKDPVLEAGLSLPYGDTLAFRLAARYQNMQGGYLDNTAQVIDPNPLYRDSRPTRGKSYKEYPGQDQRVIRLTSVWQPTDAFNATLKNFYSYTEQNDAGNTILYACADGVGGHPYYIFVPDLSQTCTHHPKLERNGALPPASIVDAHRHLSSGDRFTNEVTNFIHTLEMNYELDKLKFTSVTGYWDYRHREYTNYDYTSYAVVVSKQGESGKSFTEELRVQSSFDFPVNFMAGVFYERTKRDLDAPVQILPGIIFPPGFYPSPIPGPYLNSFISYHQHWDNNINSYAAFGNLDWVISDKWTLSGGARYTKEKRDSAGGNLYERSGLGFSPSGVKYFPKVDSDNVSPELTLSYRPIDDLMIYAAYKAGFQSAGISNPGTVPNLTALSKKGQTDALSFDESTVDGFETGIKGYFFDRRVSADLILYQYKYKKLQVGIFNPVTTTFTIQNAAEAKNKGVDFQGTWQAFDNLQLRVAAQYNRLEFESFTDAGCNAIDDAKPVASLPATGPGCHLSRPGGPKVQDLSGERYGGPPFQVNVGATYTEVFFGNWGVELTADVIHHNEGQEGLRQRGTAIQARTVTNLSARLYRPEAPWQVSLLCSNCFNEVYVTGIGNKPLAKTGDLTGFVAPPRLVTLQFTYEVR